MITIYKYIITPETQKIDMPAGAKILHAAFQYEDLFVWAEVDTDIQETESRNIIVYGTGHQINPDLKREYISTAFIGNLVFHVFEVIG